MNNEKATAFDQLVENKALLKALNEVGYESPSPIQAQTIPLLLKGSDVLGQAQTGTGKTAAFALPALSKLNLRQKEPQVLVLAPTRELAIQVAEAFQKYAKYLKSFHVLPIYGGQDYRGQIRALKRGVNVVVGTPGRVMDHMRRGTLKLDGIHTLILDEADEMLRMGFIDDVEWILEQTPAERQTALFSATMPQQIRRIAKKYLTEPAEITIKVKTVTTDTIKQRYWLAKGLKKFEALTRILEAEDYDGMIIFVRTKTATVELAEKLAARGYAVSPLNGDMQQKQRERTIEQLKKNNIDILIATDVAARGLDVQRISHVVNYDIPYDTEAYVHRIGRTGRAGRQGDAILFVEPREKRLLQAIERAVKKTVERMDLPSTDIINDKRIENFKQKITDTLANEDLSLFVSIIEQYQQEHAVSAEEIASALAKMFHGDAPFLLKNQPVPIEAKQGDVKKSQSTKRKSNTSSTKTKNATDNIAMERFRIEVGKTHQVKPSNIVAAIAETADIEGRYIGQISIFDDYSLVDLPEGMPKETFNDLKKVWVAGQQLKISIAGKNTSHKPARKPKSQARKKPRKSSKKNS